MKEFIFTWRIENINYAWHKSNKSIFSPSFTAGPIENSTWTLALYPRGDIDTDFLSLYLRRVDDNCPSSLSINCELCCTSAENLPLQSFKFKEVDKTFTKSGGNFGHPRFLRCREVFIQTKALYLSQDVLTLRCRMWKYEGTLCEFGRSFARTRLTVERISPVENINNGISNISVVNISSKLQNKSLMSIEISNWEDSTRILIDPMNVENAKFSVLKLSFVDKTTKKILCEHRSSWLGAPRRETLWLPLVCKSQDEGKSNSTKGNIEILSEFVYSTGEVIQLSENEDQVTSKSSGIIENLPRITEDLWNSIDFRDVKLNIKSTSLLAHKFVLCARSAVFLAMLTGDMKEKINECIELDDIGDDTLKKFFYFLYTDAFEELEWDAVVGLYYASDKYQVKRLKILCCRFFLEKINVDNVCELLMLADKHHDSDLKRSVEDFILQNDMEVFGSLTWKQFVKEQPFLPALTMVLKYDQERGKMNDTETYDAKLLRLPNVQDDFAAAYQGGMISDIVIKTRQSSFYAHRAILCVSSTILREKLTEDLNKSIEIFEIPDFEDDIVSRLLLFLYTESLGDVQWDAAMKLYHAADVYQIERLKMKCSSFLLENLKISNATELLLLVHECKDVQFKSLVEDYIFLHDEEIFGSDQWADFSETNFRLANETMRLKYRRN